MPTPLGIPRLPLLRTAVGATAALGLLTPAHAALCEYSDPLVLPGIFVALPLSGTQRSWSLGVEVSAVCRDDGFDRGDLRAHAGGLLQGEVSLGGDWRLALAGQGGFGPAGAEVGGYLGTVGGAFDAGAHTGAFLSAGVVWTALRFSLGAEGVRTDLVFGAKAADPNDLDRGQVVDGRPLRTADGALLPPLLAVTEAGVQRVDPARLPPVARAWALQGLNEQASVASFLKLARELVRLAAPAELVEGVRQAARDEVAHARACFQHASRHAGLRLVPGDLEVPPSESDLEALRARLIQEAYQDGLLGEGWAAAEALRALRAARCPAARATQARIAIDERRHAGLGLAILRHGLRTGGAPARDALADAMRAPLPAPAIAPTDRRTLAALTAFGQRPRDRGPDAGRARAVAARLLAA